MCTAFTLNSDKLYFGRNFDWTRSMGEEITLTPRNYKFAFSDGSSSDCHYAILGTALVKDEYPLYFDGMNEKGLVAAGLNFPGNACYVRSEASLENIASYELIGVILSRCASACEAAELLKKSVITDTPFSASLKPSPLHWIIADKAGCFTVEPLKDGLRIYENVSGVLTNSPAFFYHLHNAANYMNLTSGIPSGDFPAEYTPEAYSNGLGSFGLPGDWSSASRFVRAFYEKTHLMCDKTEEGYIGGVFRILDSCAVPEGCVKCEDNKLQYTRYSVCFSGEEMAYYYTTCSSRQINAVSMHSFSLDGDKLMSLPFIRKQYINKQI